MSNYPVYSLGLFKVGWIFIGTNCRGGSFVFTKSKYESHSCKTMGRFCDYMHITLSYVF